MRIVSQWIILSTLIALICHVDSKNFAAQQIHDAGEEIDDGKSGDGDDDDDSDSQETTNDGWSSGDSKEEEEEDNQSESPKKDRQNAAGGRQTHAKDGSQQNMQVILDANKEFSSKVYPSMIQAVGADKNLICSILSLSTVMAMVREGAKGKTRQEIDTVLSLPESGVLEGYHAVMEKFGNNEQHFVMKAANKLYVADSFELNEDYKSRTMENFMAEAENIDFSHDKQAKETINKWTEEQTEGKIKNLFSSIDPASILVLVNAIYFKANWEFEFDKNRTIKSDFTLASGDQVKVDTMVNQRLKFHKMYPWHEAGCSVLRMYYSQNKTAMYVFRPYDDEDMEALAKVEQKLSGFDYSNFEERNFNDNLIAVDFVMMPKFKLETTHGKLVSILEGAGMVGLFGHGADLSGIGLGQMHVSQVVQKAFVKVDEEGTEAAAATGAVETPASIPPSFYADKPFAFVIRCEMSGLILFQGRVMDPRKS